MELGSTKANLWRIGSNIIDLSRGVETPLSIDARPKRVLIDASATAILVIDMQNLFCQTADEQEQKQLPTAQPIPSLRRLLPYLRSIGIRVIWLNWGNRADKLNLSPSVLYPFNKDGGFQPSMLDKGSLDAEIVENLKVELDDVRIDKYRISGFWDTPLDSILRNLRILTLMFAGVNLDQCVYATLVDANCAGYDCILVEDCTATLSPSYCRDATMYNIEKALGFITDTNAITGATIARV